MCTRDWVNNHKEIFLQLALCLNMTKINYWRSDSQRLNQQWLLSCIEPTASLSGVDCYSADISGHRDPHMYFCTTCAYLVHTEARRRHQHPWNWNKRWFVSCHVGAGIVPQSSERTVSSLKHWIIFPSQEFTLKGNTWSKVMNETWLVILINLVPCYMIMNVSILVMIKFMY